MFPRTPPSQLYGGSVTSATHILLGFCGVVRAQRFSELLSTEPSIYHYNICVRACAYAPRSHMVCAGSDIGDGKLIMSKY